MAPGSGSQAVKLTCDDGFLYAVKFQGNPHGTRILAAEQVISHLGLYLGAPVAVAAHVSVSAEFVNANSIQVNGVAALPGVHHGSRWELGATDREGLAYVGEAENRDRFASLKVLYTWTCAGDSQFIYKKAAPHLVYSVDHGHFFPGSTGWTAPSLAAAPAPVLDPLFDPVGLGAADLKPFLDRLASLNPETVADAIARVRSDWGVADADLTALGNFLFARAAQIAAL